jgi:hypothetical protein
VGLAVDETQGFRGLGMALSKVIPLGQIYQVSADVVFERIDLDEAASIARSLNDKVLYFEAEYPRGPQPAHVIADLQQAAGLSAWLGPCALRVPCDR